MCSQSVFPIAPRALIAYVLPKVLPSHLYRWAKGGGIPSFHRILYFGEPPQFQLFLPWANQIGSLQKKKKIGLVRHPQLIDMQQK
jgi:hypothetical protein